MANSRINNAAVNWEKLIKDIAKLSDAQIKLVVDLVEHLNAINRRYRKTARLVDQLYNSNTKEKPV